MISRRAWSAIGLLAAVLVLLRLPVLGTGLHMDDLAQRAMVEGAYPVSRAPWDLYTFSTGDPVEVRTLTRAGALPWWSDSHLRLSALRPLASLLVWFDAVALSPWAAHLHSLLWWLAMLAALGWALRPILGGRWAWLAVALYGFDDAHAFPLAWLANRAALISGALGWLTLGLYVRRASWGWLALASAGCMAAGEYGLCALAYVAAYALVLDERPWKERLRALAPALAPTAVYLVLHRAGGFGARSSGVYLDPAADPVAFAGAVLERAPRLLFDMATGVPLSWIQHVPAAAMWGLALLVLGTTFGLVRWLQPEHRAVARWALLGAIVAVVPVCASFLSERLTVLASVGVHVLSAGILAAAVQRLLERRWSFATLVAVLVSGVLSYGHVIIAAGSSASKVDTVRRFNAAGLALADAMPVDDAHAARERWILLAVGDPMMLVYPPHLRAMTGHPRPGAFTVLCLAPGPLSMRRTSARSLEITAASGWLRTPLEQFFRRADRPLPEVSGFDEVQVEVVERDGDVPRTLRFTFARPLDDPSLRVMSVGMRGVFRYPLAGVGATMPLAPGVDAVRAVAPSL